MQKLNALESWSLYDTVVIASNVNTFFSKEAYFSSYADLANQATVPFFNSRNQSVGVQYCNMESANKMPYPYHLYSIGIDFESPTVSYGDPTDTKLPSDMFFSNELVKHCGFIFKVSQDEKLVQTCSLMPSGQGVAGYAAYPVDGSGDAGAAQHNVTNGVPHRDNRRAMRSPIVIPREATIEGQLVLSNYAREALAKAAGPGDWENDQAVPANNFPQSSQIRVTMYGYREVQQRNALHFT